MYKTHKTAEKEATINLTLGKISKYRSSKSPIKIIGKTIINTLIETTAYQQFSIKKVNIMARPPSRTVGKEWIEWLAATDRSLNLKTLEKKISNKQIEKQIRHGKITIEILGCIT